MSSPIIEDTDIVDFVIEGETYGLKRKITHGERRLLYKEALTEASKLSRGEVGADAGKPTLLVFSIKRWSLRDAAGNPVPVTMDNILKLDDSVAQQIVEEVNRRNQPPKAPTSTMSPT